MTGLKKYSPSPKPRGCPRPPWTWTSGWPEAWPITPAPSSRLPSPDTTGPSEAEGRYDGLARALGSGSQLPALGFAYTAERLLEAMGSRGADCARASTAVLVIAAEGRGYRHAARLANELRSCGKRVEMDVCGMNLDQSLDYARGRGIAEVVEVDTSGKPTSHRVTDAAGRYSAEGVA